MSPLSGEEAEVQREPVTCPGSHSRLVPGPEPFLLPELSAQPGRVYRVLAPASVELLGERRRVTGLPCERDGTVRRWPPSCSPSSSSALCPPGVSQVSSCSAPCTLRAGGSFPVRGLGNPGSHDSGVTAQPCSPAIARPPPFPGVGTQVGGGCTRPSAGLREEEVSPSPLAALPAWVSGAAQSGSWGLGRRQACEYSGQPCFSASPGGAGGDSGGWSLGAAARSLGQVSSSLSLSALIQKWGDTGSLQCWEAPRSRCTLSTCTGLGPQVSREQPL